MSGTLWIVGTPIGNLGDLSPRATETLATADLIAAEDTRRTGRLLAAAGLDRHPPMIAYFEGNERERTPELIARLAAGEAVALVTDGGMPGVSDPGYRLVAGCAAAGIDVRVVPGPSAAIAALVLSGLPTDRFAFEGFLPKKAGERRRRLDTLRDDDRTIVLFESPKRAAALLTDVEAVLGDRRVALARELTKRFEEVRRGRASEIRAQLGELRGEVVVVIEGRTQPVPVDLEACLEEARALVAAGMKKREAARDVAARHGLPANDLYRALIGPAN
jgi:16S rRNA (cytidine1402-2'-O)-methyltransferase